MQETLKDLKRVFFLALNKLDVVVSEYSETVTWCSLQTHNLSGALCLPPLPLHYFLLKVCEHIYAHTP